MVVLHFAAIENNLFNGVCVAVPQHVISQKEYANVGFINIKNIKINDLKNYHGTQMRFIKPFDVRKLPSPYNHPDIVIFHECYRFDYLQIAVNLKKNKIPYVVMPHGELRDEAQQKKHLKKSIANLLLFNRFINNSVAIQCLSKAEKDTTKFGKRKFIGTNGVNLPDQIKKCFSKKGVKFIYIGRYEWRVKGLDLLFEAIYKEADYLRKNQCSFSLYGPDILGRLEQVTQMVKEKHIEDLVSLNTEISGEEKTRLLLESDIFIQTSRHEGMPMGILEALSYGIPCLVTEGTTLNKQIEETNAGWNAGQSAEEISEKIKCSVAERSTWNTKGINGSQLIKNSYVWNTVSKKNIIFYSKLVNGRKQ